MTFKYIKFEDSETMRSLEKVVVNKGWYQPEFNKTASIEQGPDLSATSNLTENIIKLCNGLRNSGQHKYADELELKFMSYKKAETLYETSKETGEDLVDAAHPQGSHQLENVKNDEAVIETIVDQHLKDLKIVNKEPTGKLSSFNDILNAVKLVVAQEAPAVPTPPAPESPNAASLLNSIKQTVNKINENVSEINNATRAELTFSLDEYQEYIKRYSQNPTIDNLNEIKNLLEKMATRLNPKSWMGYVAFKTTGLSEDSWERVKDMVYSTIGLANKAISLRSQYVKISGLPKPTENAGQSASGKPSTPSLGPNSDRLVAWINGAQAKLREFKIKISTDGDISAPDKAKAIKWIDDKSAKVNEINEQFKSLPDNEKEVNAVNLLSNLQKITTPSFGQFKKVWID